MKSSKYILLSLTALAMLALVLAGPVMSRVEQAKYEVVAADGPLEIRTYAPMIVAQVTVPGERQEAINAGFRLIADYIFGNNTAQQKVAMTAPVMQAASEKIAMTAPVMQSGIGQNWQVRFMMPAGYMLASLPKPNNSAVTLQEIPGQRFAVIRFSGLANTQNVAKHTSALMAFIKVRNLASRGAPVYAFYNPPWTLPFLRRNEIMLALE